MPQQKKQELSASRPLRLQGKNLEDGENFVIKAGETVVIGSELVLHLKNFGHDDSDDGGQTTANFDFTLGSKKNSIMLTYREDKKLDFVELGLWKIQVVRWLHPGPPHSDEEAVELTASRTPKPK